MAHLSLSLILILLIIIIKHHKEHPTCTNTDRSQVHETHDRKMTITTRNKAQGAKRNKRGEKRKNVKGEKHKTTKINVRGAQSKDETVSNKPKAIKEKLSLK